MGLLKDAGDSILKYSEILVNKTEVYTKIAKLNLDIKRLESLIEKTERKAGQYCIKALSETGSSITSDDREMSSFITEINDHRKEIKEKKKEIGLLKQTEKSDDKSSTPE